MGQQEFEREVLDRLITIETELKSVSMQCPDCRTKLHQLEIEIAECRASIKSAHYRVDGVYKTVAWVAGGITLLINVLAFIATHIKGG